MKKSEKKIINKFLKKYNVFMAIFFASYAILQTENLGFFQDMLFGIISAIVVYVLLWLMAKVIIVPFINEIS